MGAAPGEAGGVVPKTNIPDLGVSLATGFDSNIPVNDVGRSFFSVVAPANVTVSLPPNSDDGMVSALLVESAGAPPNNEVVSVLLEDSTGAAPNSELASAFLMGSPEVFPKIELVSAILVGAPNNELGSGILSEAPNRGVVSGFFESSPNKPSGFLAAGGADPNIDGIASDSGFDEPAPVANILEEVSVPKILDFPGAAPNILETSVFF